MVQAVRAAARSQLVPAKSEMHWHLCDGADIQVWRLAAVNSGWRRRSSISILSVSVSMCHCSSSCATVRAVELISRCKIDEIRLC